MEEKSRGLLAKKNDRIQILIATYESYKYQESAGYRNWVHKENLNRIVSSYNFIKENGINSIDELKDKISSLDGQLNETKKTIRSIAECKKQLKEMMKYKKQYMSTEKVYEEYKVAYFQERYFQEHEREIIIYGAAENYFKRQGTNPKSITLKGMQNEFMPWKNSVENYKIM